MRSFRNNRVRQPHPKCGQTMTEQHHEKSCNINSIMDKYQKTGLVSHMNTHKGTYGDVSGADFKQAQDLICEQKSIFEELPASARAKFDNDPANYLDMIIQEDGAEQLAQILNPEPEPAPEPEPEPTPEPTPEPE